MTGDPQQRLERLGLTAPGEGPAAPETLRLDDDGAVPNSRLSVLVYRGDAARAGDALADFEALFTTHDWPPQWRGGVFAYHHYHSSAHEALGVGTGHARIQLGGARGPVIALRAGDAVVLPAGTGHCRVEAGGGLAVVGAYPADGPDWDLCHADPAGHDAAVARIARVPLPGSDPVTGPDGALRHLWT